MAIPFESKASCILEIGNNEGIEGVPNSDKTARKCIATRTPPNVPAE